MADEKPDVTAAPEEDLASIFGQLSLGLPEGEEETPRAESSAAKETPREAGQTQEEQTEKVPQVAQKEQAVPKSRFDEVYEKAKLYESWAPIIELFDKDPNAARRVIMERVAGRTQEQEAAPATRQPSAEEIRAYWAKRLEEDPVGGLADLVRAAVAEQIQQAVVPAIAPVRRTAVQTLVRDFKRAAKEEDPLFAHYEKVFDSVLSQTDPSLIEQNPDLVLSRAKAMAFGMWADTQRQKIMAAKGQKTLPREKPTAAAEVTASPTPSESTRAKPKRTPTREEIIISERYGIPLEQLMAEEEEGPSPFSR